MSELSRRDVALGLLFAIPFATFGTFAAWLALSNVAGWVEARAWPGVPARIIATELEDHSDSDASTYRVTATYEYEWQGTTYRSQTVGLSDMADNIGSFHQTAYRELVSYRDSGEPFLCFVDPDDPARALLYRDLRWGLVGFVLFFALIFGGIGYGLMYGLLFGSNKPKEETDLQRLHPGQPWHWDPDWGHGRVQGAGRSRVVGSWALALFWNLISAPVLFAIPSELEDGNRLILLALVFPIAGAWLLGNAILQTLRWRRFGGSVFEMREFPGRLGGLVAGRVQTRMRQRPDAPLRVLLSCVRLKSEGTGKGSSGEQRVLWQDEVEIAPHDLQLGADGLAVHVEFAIPEDLPPSPDDASSGSVRWRLEVRGDLPGVDFAADFSVPVFPAQDGATPRPRQPRPPAPPSSPDTIARLGRWGIHVEQRTDTTRVRLAPARHKSAVVGLGVFTILWVGAIALMMNLGAPWFFPVLFGAFLPLVLYGLVEMALTTRSVVASPAGLEYRRAVLGAGRLRRLPADEIATIATARGMQSGNKLYYRVEVTDRAGKKHVVATEIDELRAAEWLVAELRRALGPDSAPVSAAA